MKIALLLIVFVLICAPLNAQDADAGWPIVERCVSEPATPPEGWAFEGTIFMTGYAGIHAIRDEWETPHVAVFLREKDVWGGALSPDGRWYASPYGTITTTESFNVITEVEAVHIYPTSGEDRTYTVPLDPSFYFFPQQTHAQVYWRDNESFLYGSEMIQPFNGDTTRLDYLDDIFDAYPHLRTKFAPDWTLTVAYNSFSEDTGSKWTLHDLTEAKSLVDLNIRFPIAWLPDSSAFAATVSSNDDIPINQLQLFDRNGIELDTILVGKYEQQFSLYQIDWSASGRYLAFVVFDYPVKKEYPFSYPYMRENTLHIADRQNKTIINTCLTIGEGLAWSPHGDQLAVLDVGRGLKDVMVLDVATNSLYAVAKHIVGTSDSIIGWRAD